MLVLFWQTVQLMWTFGLTPSAAMQIPMGFFFGSGMIFVTIAVIEYIRQTIGSIRVLCGGRDQGPIVGPGGVDLKEAVKL
jgi:TRAP-type C4-dicarboxylate transport system permease small subunit